MGNGKIWPSADAKLRTDRHQIWSTWLRRGYLPPQKIRGQSAQGFLPPTYVKYTPKTFECLLLFFHSSSESLQTRSLDRFSRLIRHTTWKCIWEWEKLISKFDRLIRKIREIYNGAYGEIFDSRVGFLGTGYLMALFKLTPGLPLLPWQRNLGQNRL